MRWDIFCSVVDNYGDIGVAWRLARQLAAEHGLKVRLWVDDLASLAAIWPTTDIEAKVQRLERVEVHTWHRNAPTCQAAEVVIEAFGCRLPEAYLEAMTRSAVAPLWINLEYLTAEDWTRGCHGLPSPHPRLPLTQYFFYPGYDEASGGLLRERDLARARDAFQASPAEQAAFRRRIDLEDTPEVDWRITLFAYETPAVGELLEEWASGPDKVELIVPQGRIAPAVAAWFGAPPATGGAIQSLRRGTLCAHILPMLAQDDYDRLLWQSDCNFVRGEDSMLRAQFAGVPFIWQAYRQDEDAHHAKLSAFMGLYRVGMPDPAARALTAMWSAWNAAPDRLRPRGELASAWAAWRAQRPTLTHHAREWAAQRLAASDLASRLVDFCVRHTAAQLKATPEVRRGSI